MVVKTMSSLGGQHKKTYSRSPSVGKSAFSMVQFSKFDFANPAIMTKITTQMFRHVKMLLNLKK